MEASPATLTDIKTGLTTVARDCLDRGLYHSSQWANEMARSMDISIGYISPAPPSPQLMTEYDMYQAALIAFHGREFKRAQHLLLGTTSNQCRFLRAYSCYLDGEKTLEDNGGDLIGSNQDYRNQSLMTLDQEMKEWPLQGEMDGFELWLRATVHRDLHRHTQAKNALKQAVSLTPFFITAWLDLAALVDSVEEANQMALTDHVMKEVFMAALEQGLYLGPQALARYQQLLKWFPQSDYCSTQLACVYVNMRDYDPALALFTQIRQRSPLRLDGMDTYSNILYVREMTKELSILAHSAYEIDKYRPETCCIVGNFYSLRKDHAKALLYFERALQLDPHNSAAWTLIGHEYVEQNNYAGAIDAYKRALDNNPREFRAWSGLGQVYDIMHLYPFAAYYYNKACMLKPSDGRLWVALGQTLVALGRQRDAINCYQRADQDHSQRKVAQFYMAQLYLAERDLDSAADCYVLYLQVCEALRVEDNQDTIQAALFLARYYRDRGQLADAEPFAAKICQYSGRELDEAQEILNEARRSK